MSRSSLAISAPTRGIIRLRGSTCGARREMLTRSLPGSWHYILPVYHREPLATACQAWSALGERSIKKECRKRTSWPASFAMVRMAKASEIFPLGGLDSTYLRRRLEQWNQGYHAAAGPPMISIASKLADDQIEALASYLSFIK